jgi:hypothetical protein
MRPSSSSCWRRAAPNWTGHATCATSAPRRASALRAAAASGDTVLCCGGIGATPDDHTRQAAALALGLPLQPHAEAQQLIRERVAEMARERGEPPPDEAQPDMRRRLEMGVLPAGCRLIPNPYNRIAGFSVGRLHFVPGFPVMAHPMMAWVLENEYGLAEQPASVARALLHRRQRPGGPAHAADGANRGRAPPASRSSVCLRSITRNGGAASNWGVKAGRDDAQRQGAFAALRAGLHQLGAAVRTDLVR